MAFLAEALAFAVTSARSAGISARRAADLEVCIEEILVNIISYAYPSDEGTMVIDCESQEEGFSVTIRDKGFPYNPLAAADPDLTAPIEKRQVGGLGVYLVKNLMDDVVYNRDGEENVLTIFLRRDA